MVNTRFLGGVACLCEVSECEVRPLLYRVKINFPHPSFLQATILSPEPSLPQTYAVRGGRMSEDRKPSGRNKLGSLITVPSSVYLSCPMHFECYGTEAWKMVDQCVPHLKDTCITFGGCRWKTGPNFGKLMLLVCKHLYTYFYDYSLYLFLWLFFVLARIHLPRLAQ